MPDVIINTTPPTFQKLSQDPYDELDTEAWVDKQIEYGSQEHTVSGRGLLPYIKQLKGELVGCEIGVCNGFTTEYLVKNILNIKTLYAVDNYPIYIDWNGTRLTEERQEESKRRCAKKLSQYSNITLVYKSSTEFAKSLDNDSLDFIFIDGDHSYKGVIEDIKNYWPKVKNNGVFAGHDINLASVRRAIKDSFSGMPNIRVEIIENNGWIILK
ncbi:MAG: Synechococcus phage [Bacteroidota bacterium]|jgi:predicted O-methyltransferase YrrM